MPVDAKRVREEIEALAAWTATPGAGTTRFSFTEPWLAAREHIKRSLESAGCNVKVDAFGNLRARPTGVSWESPAWMCGSHLDTVRGGGNFDGVAGVVAALEAVRCGREVLKVAHPLEVVVLAETRGCRFGEPMLGSRALSGELTPDRLAELRDQDGVPYAQAGGGVDPSRWADDRLKPGSVLGFVEVHVEQAPGMWEEDIRLAFASVCTGRRVYAIDLHGPGGHAGCIPMPHRADPMQAACEILLRLEQVARDSSVTLTCGRLEAQPGMHWRIADTVRFNVDVRAAVTSALVQIDRSLKELTSGIADARRVRWDVKTLESDAVVQLDDRIISKLHRVYESRGIEPLPKIASVFLHDAAVMAARLPAALLLVPSYEGIHDCPEERARPEDIAQAAAAVMEIARDRRIE